MATPTLDLQIKLPQLPTRELGLENMPAFCGASSPASSSASSPTRRRYGSGNATSSSEEG